MSDSRPAASGAPAIVRASGPTPAETARWAHADDRGAAVGAAPRSNMSVYGIVQWWSSLSLQ